VTPRLRREPRAASPPPYLPVVKAAGESEHPAGQVTQPEVVALQDNVAQGTALQGRRGVCGEAREEAARPDLQGTLRKRQQDPERHGWPQSRPQSRASSLPRKGTTSPARYLEVTVLDGAASRQPHGSFQQAVGDRRAVLQETGLLPRAQRHVGPGCGRAARSDPPETCVSKAEDRRTYVHVGVGCFAEAEVAGRAGQARQAADVVACRGGHVVVGRVGDAGCGGGAGSRAVSTPVANLGVPDTGVSQGQLG